MPPLKKKTPKKGGKPSKRWVPPPPKKKTTTRHQPKKASKAMAQDIKGEEANRFRQQQTSAGQHPSSTPGGKSVEKDKESDKDKEAKGKTGKGKSADTGDPEAEGDPEKGKIDPDDPDKLIAMKDRRAYLIDQAEKNERANDELNAIQTAQNENFRKRQLENSPFIDPDKQRDESMVQARAQLKLHDPSNRAEGDEQATPAPIDQTSADFKAGQVLG